MSYDSPLFKVFFAVLLLAEIFCIAVNYHESFQDFIGAITILGAIIIAFFAYKLITLQKAKATVYDSTKATYSKREGDQVSHQTREALNNLQKT